jgi:hypothetical protein
MPHANCPKAETMTNATRCARGMLPLMLRTIFGWALAIGLVSSATGCKGEPPSLVAAEGKRLVAVGETLVIVLFGSDPDDGDLDYGFATDAPEVGGTATISKRPDGSGLFTWTPRASHVGTWEFDFHVSDGRNKAKLAIPVEVRGAVGEGTQPIFRKPLGHGAVLPLARQDCIELEIEVDDQDSTSVVLTQEPPLAPGATLTTEGSGLRGTWTWCPRKEKVDGVSTYKLRLGADDGDNPKVIKDFTVAVRKRSATASMNCPGEPPVLEHKPRDFQTVRDLEISAAVHDDSGLAGPPLVLYSTEPPGDPVDATKMQMVEMELVSGTRKDGSWRAVIPNPLASDNRGGTTDLYYLFTVADDDDANGDSCDHVIDVPARGTHRISVTRPADAGTDEAKEEGLEVCEPCSADVQCGTASDFCIRPSTGGDAFCSRGCENDGCPDGTVCSASEVESVDGERARQCVPEVGQCNSGTGDKPSCESDAANRSIDLAAVLAPGERPTQTICPESGKIVQHWYRITVDEPRRIDASLSTDQGLDFALSLVNEAGLQLALSDSLESSEAFSSCLLPGSYYLTVSAKPETSGDVYLLTYDLEQSESCRDKGSECCALEDTPGCGSESIESCVCAADPFCCEVAWDGQCVAEVQAMGCGECDLEPLDCCEPSFLPGCDDASVEACVCDLDPLCCDVANGWDMLCVVEVEVFGCGSCGLLPPGSDCCEPSDAPGCNDAAVEACVCAADSFCCDPQESWDALCVSQVDSLGCGSCGDAPAASCCEGHETPGCGDAAIESCVCSQDPFCCSSKWDALCASRVESYGCGTCNDQSQPLCTDTCQYANDGWCDDGGPDADFSVCELGTDCGDCGPRQP